MSSKAVVERPKSKPTDYQDLRKQIGDYESTFYGPHSCDHCNEMIVRQAIEQGGQKYTIAADNVAGGKYKPHVCKGGIDPHMGYSHFDSINYSVRHLAGKILTIIDATAGDPQQRKATKDLVKEAFKHALDQIHSGCFAINVVGGCAATVEPLQSLD